MSKKIVGVCSANVQRSATFDAVVNYELENQGITELEVSSAGINVEKILANESSLCIQINMLKAGLHYGIVRDEIRRRVEEIVERGYKQEHTDDIKALYGEVRPMVHGFIIALRNQALAEVGIKKFPPPYTKFDPKKSFNLVLPMAEKDTPKIEARYEGTNIEKPRIITYNSLVGIDELVDDISAGLAGARKTVEYFMDTRKTAIQNMQEN